MIDAGAALFHRGDVGYTMTDRRFGLSLNGRKEWSCYVR